MRHLQQVIAELKRRRVFRALLAWGIFSFAVLQVVEPVLHAVEAKDWVLKLVVAALAAGFPIAVVLAWIFDLGPGGVTRTADALPDGSGEARTLPRRFTLAGPVFAALLLGRG